MIYMNTLKLLEKTANIHQSIIAGLLGNQVLLMMDQASSAIDLLILATMPIKW